MPYLCPRHTKPTGTAHIPDAPGTTSLAHVAIYVNHDVIYITHDVIYVTHVVG